MLKEVIDLQNKAINNLINKINTNENEKTITFKSPTGSGKTYMMASFMNQILEKNNDIIFLISSLSKSNLAKQNAEKFEEYKKDLNNLNVELINTETTEEEGISIPDNKNVYILPTDLYKKGGKIVPAFKDWLIRTTKIYNKKIYLIKDESHVETTNLNNEFDYFTKIINFSATPNLDKGKYPDVEITEFEAEKVNLIKHVYEQTNNYKNKDDCYSELNSALNKFQEVRQEYKKLLGINPCFIIQISNKSKAKEELQNISKILENNHSNLNWMYIVTNEKTSETTNDSKTNDVELQKTKPEIWKDLARQNVSTIDVIIFKLKIKEGWDIPRACMLFQIRETQSKTLDEQVVGRIRRNPKLLDFNKLTKEQQELCTKAYVWGIREKSTSKIREVENKDKNKEIKIKITKLKSIKSTSFDINKCLLNAKIQPKGVSTSIFDLYEKQQHINEEINILYKSFVKTPEDWFKFNENLDLIKKEVNTIEKDYKNNMYIPKDEFGKEIEYSLPHISYFVDNENTNHYTAINDWIWRRTDNSDNFSFDSEAEEEWAEELKKLTALLMKKDNNTYLWGKNYLTFSDICFEYYDDGIHKSYPDFIMKDKKNNIHLFEIKSIIKSTTLDIDENDYLNKIEKLKECYIQSAKLTGYNFYIPILNKDIHNKISWDIWYAYKSEETSEIEIGTCKYNGFLEIIMKLLK